MCNYQRVPYYSVEKSQCSLRSPIFFFFFCNISPWSHISLFLSATLTNLIFSLITIVKTCQKLLIVSYLSESVDVSRMVPKRRSCIEVDPVQNCFRV